MASTSETGHLKNVTQFETLLAFVNGYGVNYAPSNPNILLTALQLKKTTAESNLLEVKNTEIPLSNSRGKRKTLFDPLKPLSTRIVGALQAAGAPETTIKNAQTINRKIQGKRAPGAPKPDKATAETPDTISTSQQSFDRLADFFQELIKLLESEPSYNPNESDLKTSALNTYQQELINANKDVTNVYTPYSNAIIARDKTLYSTKTGIIDIAQDVKIYVKSVFGASSPEYAQVKGIKFSRPRK